MKPSLRLRSLKVHQAPGLVRPLDLSESIGRDLTLVFGPNASGKTTVAQSVAALFWPGAENAQKYFVAGEWESEGGRFAVEQRFGKYKTLSDGMDASPPACAPDEARDRYFLDLRGLLQANGKEYAAVLMREFAGGYDVNKAARDLDYKFSASRKGRLNQQLQDAQEQLRKAREQESELVKDERNLDHLDREIDALTVRAAAATHLGKAIEAAVLQGKLGELEAALAGMPKELEGYTGTERQDLERITQGIEAKKDQVDKSAAALEKAESLRDKQRLPEIANPDVLRRELEILLKRFHESEREERDAGKAMADAQGRLEEVLRVLGNERPAPAAPPALEDLREIDSLLEKTMTVEADRKARETLLDWLGPEESAEAELGRKRENIHAALALARNWMSEPDPSSGAGYPGWRKGLLALAGVLLSLSGLCVAAGFLPGFLPLAERVFPADVLKWAGIASCLVFLLAMAFVWREPRFASKRSILESEFPREDVEPPAEWKLDEVSAWLKKTESLRQDVERRIDRVGRWQNLRGRIEEARRIEESLETDLRAVADRIGLHPGASLNSFRHEALKLRDWYVAFADYKKARKVRDRTREERSETLRLLRERLAAFGHNPEEGAQAEAAVEDVARRLEIHREETEKALRERESLRRAKRELETLREEWNGLFRRRNLEPGDQSALLRLHGLLPEYKKLRAEMESARHTVGHLRNGLPADMLDKELETLRGELEEAENAGKNASISRDERASIRERIRHAKRDRNIETALARVASCRESLRRERAEEAGKACGMLLAQYVVGQCRLSTMPRVLRRAQELFSSMTRGNFELRFNPDKEDFHAMDTVVGVCRELDELSAATRLQLLLAVRLAFVEEQEQGPRLPLLLDETLANSDETRAEAMIGAVLDICRGGRQVFYFTAQAGELNKWIRRLENQSEIEWKTLFLEETVRLAERRELPFMEAPSPPAAAPPPEPGGMDHDEYGRLLKVPGIDPWSENQEGLHLWYLIDDPAALYDFLSLGLSRWGQLRSCLETQKLQLFEKHGRVLRRARALADAVSFATAVWRVGRGRMVSPRVLPEAGVSETFVEKVEELLEECQGNARFLIRALQEKRVKRFQVGVIEKMEAWFRENGYLDDLRPLHPTELRDRVLDRVIDRVEAGVLAHDDVNRIVSRLPAAPALPV